MNFLKPLIDLILPPRCFRCGKIVQAENTLCSDCFQKIDFISAPYCKICGRPFETEMQTTSKLICPNCLTKRPKIRLSRSAFLYSDFSQKLILSFKFGDRTDLIKIFAKWLSAASNDIIKEGVDLIIPVPLSYLRLLKRRYNQSALLAKEFAKIKNIDIDVSNLVKIKHTKAQAQLNFRERLKNVNNAYKVKYPDRIKGKHILLIDDVMTTGATLNECAKTLLKAGAETVDALTLARRKKE